jgi:NAD(P)-dependent dehydrogenase (short-subunit alcohol dehydrogenase family)
MRKESVIITGAASGIGAATVTKYLEQTDFDVIAVDINSDGLSALISDRPDAQQQRVTLITVDLTDHQSVSEKLIADVERRGGVDHVVISHAIGIENDIKDSATWDLVLNVNLHATQRLLAMLTDFILDEGRVVVMSSVLGRAGKAVNTGYVTSKHALLGLVKALAMDWAAKRITVNAVLPCWVDTPMLRRELEPQAAVMGLQVKQVIRQIKKRIPLRQLISASDVADTVMFLTSPAAKMITAQSIVVDGGFGCGV